MRDIEFRHITTFTIQNGGWNGYWVRLRNKNAIPGFNAIASKTFPISEYGDDWDKALGAAKKWRNKTMKSLGYLKNGSLVGVGHSHLKSKARRTKTGKDRHLPIGISHTKRLLKNGGYSYGFKAVISPGPMQILTKQFGYKKSVKGSKDTAFKMAVKLRRKWEKEFYKQ